MPSVGNVLVGGGTGFIGSNLCKILKHRGYGVTIVSRMPGPQRISWGELHKKGLPEEFTAVVNLAGQNVMNMKQRWTAGFKQNVFTSRVNTTSALATAIKESQKKPKVFVSMSGVGCYKPDPIKEYTESMTCEDFDFFSTLCRKWESAANLSSMESQCRVAIIRSGVVLGRSGGMIQQLYLPFYMGLGGPVGNGEQFLPWIHINDLVELIIYAIENENVKGVLNGVAPQVITNKEFSNAFAKALHRPAIFPVPESIFNILLGKERASMITKGQKVIPQKTLSTGFKFNYPNIDAACKAIVENKG